MARNAAILLLLPKFHNRTTKKIPTWCFALAAANVGLEELKKEFACYIYIYICINMNITMTL